MHTHPLRLRTRDAVFAAVLLIVLAAAAFPSQQDERERETALTGDTIGGAAVGGPEAAAAGSRIARVDVKGNERISTDTVLFYLSLKAGDPFDRVVLQDDVRKLWQTQFFEDVRVDAEDAPGGVVLTYMVKERPIVASLEFKGSKELSAESIQKELKEKNLKIAEGDPLDKALLEKVRSAIADMLQTKGFRFSKVESRVSDLGGARSAVVYDINDGGKVRIEQIAFEGNLAFSDSRLRGTFKKTHEHGFWSWLRKGDTYDTDRMQEDIERLREHYYNHGYIRFNAGEPDLKVVEPPAGGKRTLHITIPVEEGEQYRVGKVAVSGNTIFSEKELHALVLVKPGEVVSRKKLIESRQSIESMYGEEGYINASPNPLMLPVDKPGERLVDVTIDIDEGEQVYVNRIEFRGNTSTKDKVIRRQMKLDEGDVFNTALFNRSLMRIYQTGFFGPPKPRYEPVKDDPTKIDLTVELEEQGKNDVRFGGGVSQVEGFFGTFAFSTRNFLGTGNSVTVDIQAGARTNNYRVLYLDPYLADRPLTLGIDAFRRRLDYPQYDREGTGGNLTFGSQFSDFLGGRVSYSYEEVLVTNIDAALITNPVTLALLKEGTYQVSKVTPQLVYSSIDNPTDPFKGYRSIFSVDIAGGALGGGSNFIKPRVDGSGYIPFGRKTSLAFHGEFNLVKGYGGQPAPLFERFFLGGEQSIRGYEAWSISPVDEDGNMIGGVKSFVFNIEYQIKLAQPFRLVAFADAGQTFAENDTIGVSDFLYSTGVEFRFFTPIMQAPLRLIYAYVPKPLEGGKKTNFTFSIGTTF